MKFTFLLITALVIVGCGTTSSNSTPDAGSPKMGPFTLQVTQEADASVSQVIGPDGGTMVAKGQDGTVFTIVFPPKAMPVPFEIKMTPIQTLGGHPFKKFLAGVAFEPEGLIFPPTVTLSVALPQEAPKEVVAFAYSGDGKDLELALPVIGKPLTTMRVLHFSGYGVAEADEAGIFVPGDPNTANYGDELFQHEIAAELRQEAIRQLSGDTSSNDLMARILEKMLARYKLRAAELLAEPIATCEAGGKLIGKILTWEKNLQLAGADGSEGSVTDAALFEAFKKMVDACIPQAQKECTENNKPQAMLSKLVQLEQAFQLSGFWESEPGYYSSATTRMSDAISKCYSFDVTFNMTQRTSSPDTYTFVSRAQATVQLRPKTANSSGWLDSFFASAELNGESTYSLDQLSVTWTGFNVRNVSATNMPKIKVTNLKLKYVSEDKLTAIDGIDFTLEPDKITFELNDASGASNTWNESSFSFLEEFGGAATSSMSNECSTSPMPDWNPFCYFSNQQPRPFYFSTNLSTWTVAPRKIGSYQREYNYSSALGGSQATLTIDVRRAP